MLDLGKQMPSKDRVAQWKWLRITPKSFLHFHPESCTRRLLEMGTKETSSSSAATVTFTKTKAVPLKKKVDSWFTSAWWEWTVWIIQQVRSYFLVHGLIEGRLTFTSKDFFTDSHHIFVISLCVFVSLEFLHGYAMGIQWLLLKEDFCKDNMKGKAHIQWNPEVPCCLWELD